MADYRHQGGYFRHPTNDPVGSVLSAAGDRIAGLFVAPTDDVQIDRIGFYGTTINGAPTVDVSLETLANDIAPSDEWWVPSGINAVSTSPGLAHAVASGWQWVPLATASTAIVKGDMYAAVVRGNNIGGGADFVGGYVISQAAGPSGFPTGLRRLGAAIYTRGNGIPMVAARYTNGLVIPGIACVNGFDEGTNLTVSTTPDEVGIKWTQQADEDCNGYHGVWNNIFVNNHRNQVVLYDSAHNAIASVTTNIQGIRSTGVQVHYDGWEPTALTAGSVYRLVLKPLDTGAQRFTIVSWADDDSKIACVGDMVKTERTNGGLPWTDTPLDTVPLFPTFSTATPGGGGGGLIPGDWNGGFNG